MAFYAAVIRTPADQVPAGSPVIQSYEETPEGSRKIKLADKIAAGAALSKMTGWNEPERIELSADSLTSYLLELRQQPFIGGRVLELERPVLPLKDGAKGEEEPLRRSE